MPISFIMMVVFLSFRKDQKRWHAQVDFCWLSCVVLNLLPPHPLSSFALLSSVLSLFASDAKGWPKEQGGGNSSRHCEQSSEQPYCREHLWKCKLSQDIYSGHYCECLQWAHAGGEACHLEVNGWLWDALWRSCAWNWVEEDCRLSTYCILGLVLAGKNPQCSIDFTNLIAKPNHAMKGLTTYLPSTKSRDHLMVWHWGCLLCTPEYPVMHLDMSRFYSYSLDVPIEVRGTKHCHLSYRDDSVMLLIIFLHFECYSYTIYGF